MNTNIYCRENNSIPKVEWCERRLIFFEGSENKSFNEYEINDKESNNETAEQNTIRSLPMNPLDRITQKRTKALEAKILKVQEEILELDQASSPEKITRLEKSYRELTLQLQTLHRESFALQVSDAPFVMLSPAAGNIGWWMTPSASMDTSTRILMQSFIRRKIEKIRKNAIITTNDEVFTQDPNDRTPWRIAIGNVSDNAFSQLEPMLAEKETVPREWLTQQLIWIMGDMLQDTNNRPRFVPHGSSHINAALLIEALYSNRLTPGFHVNEANGNLMETNTNRILLRGWAASFITNPIRGMAELAAVEPQGSESQPLSASFKAFQKRLRSALLQGTSLYDIEENTDEAPKDADIKMAVALLYVSLQSRLERGIIQQKGHIDLEKKNINDMSAEHSLVGISANVLGVTAAQKKSLSLSTETLNEYTQALSSLQTAWPEHETPQTQLEFLQNLNAGIRNPDYNAMREEFDRVIKNTERAIENIGTTGSIACSIAAPGIGGIAWGAAWNLNSYLDGRMTASEAGINMAIDAVPFGQIIGKSMKIVKGGSLLAVKKIAETTKNSVTEGAKKRFTNFALSQTVKRPLKNYLDDEETH